MAPPPKPSNQSLMPNAIPQLPIDILSNPPAGFPDWATLFGDSDYCYCDHCCSVLSPAACLVDCLEFLKNCPQTTGNGNLLDVFTSRRGDIPHLELSCINTNTVLPYIDLVNEVLEEAILPTNDPNAKGRQTTGTAADLAIHPEHLKYDVYQKLASATYLWELPFDLRAEEIRRYLTLTGVTRYQLMETLDATDPDTSPDPTQVQEIAREHLAMPMREWEIVTGPANGAEHELWGLTATQWAALWTVSVSELLQLSGLEYESLDKLLRCGFVNPKAPDTLRRVGVAFTEGSCNLDTARLRLIPEPNDAEQFQQVLGRLHRFVRLQRRLGWSEFDLDKALLALGGVLDSETVAKLSHFERLRAEMRVPVVELAAWYGPLSTDSPNADHPSLYDRLFQNRGISLPDDDAFVAFSLNPAKTELANVSNGQSRKLKELTPATEQPLAAVVLGALGVSADVLDQIIQYIKPNSDAPIDLNNLTKLYRIVSLARALKLKVDDLVTLLNLTGIDVFLNPARTREFVCEVQANRVTKIPIIEIAALLRGRSPLTNKEIETQLEACRQVLQQVAAETTPTPDPSGEVLKSMLRIGLDPAIPDADIDQVVALADGLLTDASAQAKAWETLTTPQGWSAHFTEPVRAKLINLTWKPDNEAFKALGFPEGTSRLEYVQAILLKCLREQLAADRVIEFIAAALKLSGPMASALLAKHVLAIVDPDSFDPPLPDAACALSAFLNDRFATSTSKVTLDAQSDDDEHQIYQALGNNWRRLDSISRLITSFNVDAEELAILFGVGADHDWLDLNTLPVSGSSDPKALHDRYEKWCRLRDVYALRDQMGAARGPLFDVFRQVANSNGATTEWTAAREQIIALLVDRAGWPKSDLGFLVGTEAMVTGFGLVEAAQWLDERRLIRLLDAIRIVVRSRLSASQLWIWSRIPDASADQSAQAVAVKQAVRARFDETSWPATARPVRNALRDAQRRALVAYLIGNGTPSGTRFSDANALYGHFLIDVEMCACAETSRIREALSAVQLFLQRVLLGLEKESNAELTAQDAQLSKTMFNYRVWEANRKIFLWPENWPDWRDDKTPFCVELETQLQQEPVTLESAERAYREYLTKLDDVARLEICTVYHQVEKDRAGSPILDILHVVGRTRGEPHRYYYRTREEGEWKGWSRVEADIQGDHLIATVFNRRLLLLWPVFLEKAKEETDPSKSKGNPPKKMLEVRLAWSEYRDGRWGPKRVTDTVHTYGGGQAKDKRLICFQAQQDIVGDLRIYWGLQWNWGDNSYGIFVKVTILRGSDGSVVTSSSGPFIDILVAPPECAVVRQTFRSSDQPTGLELPITQSDAYPTDRVLGKTPTSYELVPQYPRRLADQQMPSVFFQDQRRTFLVEPMEGCESWADDETDIIPAVIDLSKWKAINDSSIPDPGPQILPDTVANVAAAMQQWVGYHAGGIASPTKETHYHTMSANGIPSPYTTGLGLHGDITAFICFSPGWHYTFHNFYHPHVTAFRRQLNRFGIDGLLAPRRDNTDSDLERRLMERQMLGTNAEAFKFQGEYAPTLRVEGELPKEDVDFRYGGAYSPYNWELFFHIPFYIGTNAIRENPENALKWLQYIFDPTDTPDWGEAHPARYWKIKPFYKPTAQDQLTSGSIENLLLLLAENPTDSESIAVIKALNEQIDCWRLHWGQPSRLMRLRPQALRKAVVMRWLDAVIAWADMLFRQFTIESVGQAAQLYVLASELLGRRPERVEVHRSEVKTYSDLSGELDTFSNAAIEDAITCDPITSATASNWDDLPPIVSPTTYFCVPPNEKLLGYWDTVADRLFKIRHCLDIDGVARPLALFDPPIDPALLVKAAAAGLDISSVVAGLYAPLPRHRFTTILQKALDVCGDVRALGGALMRALEARDAETLTLLRSGHEQQVLERVKEVKKQQISEAEEAKAALEKTLAVTTLRIDRYAKYLKDGYSPAEKTHLSKLDDALQKQLSAQALSLEAKAMAQLPDFDAGSEGMSSPVVKARFGGSLLSFMRSYQSDSLTMQAQVDSHQASRASIQASFERRAQDWQLQFDLASKEADQIRKQIASADIRIAIAERELENHEKQIEQARELDDFYRYKFTNAELYNWTVSQVSAIYFQSYQLALDLARQAQRAWQFEVAAPTPPDFIQSSNWDSLRKGLLAGERLQLDLRRMEKAYMEQAAGRYELTRHVSLLALDAKEVITLRSTGECDFTIPELVTAIDLPSVYDLRIKSVAVSIPCVVGPYTPLHAKLTLLRSSVRRNALLKNDEYRRQENEDDRFVDNYAATCSSIMTSSGREDSGRFEVSLQSAEYLPFEGAGLCDSVWRLELPAEFRAFDYNTISDVILHIRCSGREGGAALRNAAVKAVKAEINAEAYAAAKLKLTRVFSLKTEFSSAWQAFLNPTDPEANPAIEFALTRDRFPFVFQGANAISIHEITVYVVAGKTVNLTSPSSFSASVALVSPKEGGSDSEIEFTEPELNPIQLAVDSVLSGAVKVKDGKSAPTGYYRLTISSTGLDSGPLRFAPDGIRDVFVVAHYSVDMA